MVSDRKWTRLTFSLHPEIVYVLKIRKGSGEFFPFYVGISETRSIGRFGDYISCQYNAPTDFNVGTALRRLEEKGYEFVADYYLSEDARPEEKTLIRKHRSEGFVLLNEELGYHPGQTTEEAQRERVRRFVDEHFG